jgi:hypothetical protein
MFTRYARRHKRNHTMARTVRVMPMRQYRNDVMGTKISASKDTAIIVRGVRRANTVQYKGEVATRYLPTYKLYGDIPVFGYLR